MSTVPAPPSVPKLPSDAPALDQASFAAYLHSGHAAEQARLEAEFHEETQHSRTADLLPESDPGSWPSSLFIAHRASALPDPGAWLARAQAGLQSPAGIAAEPGAGSVEQEALQSGAFAALQDEDIHEQLRLDRRGQPAAWATPLVQSSADDAPVFELRSEPPRLPAQQSLAARVADRGLGAEVVDGELPPPSHSLASPEIEWAHRPTMPWWMPRPPDIEAPGVPGLIAARHDKPLFTGMAPRSPGSAVSATDVSAVPDFAYQRFEWDQDFGFNPWNAAPQALLSGASL